MAELKGRELEDDLDIQRRSKENVVYMYRCAEYQLIPERSWKTLYMDYYRGIYGLVKYIACDLQVQRCCLLDKLIIYVHVSPRVMTVLKKLKDLGDTSVGVRIFIIDDDKVILNVIDEALLSKTMMSLLDTCINSVGKRYKLEKGIMRLLREQKFVDHVSKILEEKGANVAWKANSGNWNSITVYGITEADVDLWLKVMKEELVCYEIQLNDRMLKTLKYRSWFEARKEFESNPLLVLEKKETTMKLYGTRDEAEIAKEKIEELLCANNIGIKISLQLPSAFSIPFGPLSDACRSIVESFRDDSLKIESDEANGSFVISGPNQLVSEVERKIKDLLDNIVLEEVFVKQLGMFGHFLSAVRIKLENTHLAHGVYIEHLVENSESCEDTLRKKGSVSKQSAQLPGSRNDQLLSSSENEVTFKLRFGEIVKCRMDAIVNVVREWLKQDTRMSGNSCDTAYEDHETPRFIMSDVENSEPFQYYLTPEAQEHLKRKRLNLLKMNVVLLGESTSDATCVKDRIVLEGEDINLLIKEILKLNSSVCKTFEMDEGNIRMLVETKFVDHIKKCLIDKCVNVKWVKTDWNKITMHGPTENDIDCANAIIKEELVYYQIQLNEGQCAALKNPLWLDLKKAVKKHPLLMLEETGMMVKIYGAHELVGKFKTEVQNFLNEYQIVTKSIAIDADKYSVMSLLLSAFVVPFSSYPSITGHKLSAGSFNFFVTESVFRDSNQKIGDLGDHVSEITLKARGISEHFQSVVGKMKLENIRYKYGVLVENITEGFQSCEEKVQENDSVLPIHEVIDIPIVSEVANFIHSHREFNNGASLKLIVGEIAKCSIDAVVNVVTKHLKHFDRASTIIYNAGGPSIQEECDEYIARYGPRLEGDIFVSQSGGLLCKNVFHVVSPDWSKNKCLVTLSRTVTGILSKAEELKFTSLAMPIIGSKINGLEMEKVSKIIHSAINDWIETSCNYHLKEIHIVDSNIETINAFHSYMDDKDVLTGLIEEDMRRQTTSPGEQDGITSQKCLGYETPVKLRFFGANDVLIWRAVEDLEQYCAQVIQTIVIDDEDSAKIIQKLTSEQVSLLKALEKEFCVHIDVNRDEGRIKIEGELQYVAEVKYRMLSILQCLHATLLQI